MRGVGLGVGVVMVEVVRGFWWVVGGENRGVVFFLSWATRSGWSERVRAGNMAVQICQWAQSVGMWSLDHGRTDGEIMGI